jgi:hypothetical protein
VKKYTIVIILLTLVIFGTVFFVGKNKKEIVINVPAPDNQTSTATAPKKEVVSTPGVILAGDRAKYENLSEEEKQLLEQYYSASTKDLKQTYKDDMPISGCYLKYYNANVILVGCAVPKPGISLSLVERGSWGTLPSGSNCGIDLWGGIAETSKYIIAIADKNICYFKAGDESIINLPGAHLTSKDEWYVKIGGMANEYDFTFDESSKTLTASVFKVVYSSSGKPNPKIRTATFTLP